MGVAEEDSMASYRLFMLNDKGRVRDLREVLCEDDRTTILRASEYPNDHGVEVWQLTRCVAVLKPPMSKIHRSAVSPGRPAVANTERTKTS